MTQWWITKKNVKYNLNYYRTSKKSIIKTQEEKIL